MAEREKQGKGENPEKRRKIENGELLFLSKLMAHQLLVVSSHPGNTRVLHSVLRLLARISSGPLYMGTFFDVFVQRSRVLGGASSVFVCGVIVSFT